MKSKTNSLKPFRSRRGFSLVELLVVIAILAILATLLAPAISKARSRAKNVICASNIRQIGLAAIEYSTDHNGLFPTSWDWVKSDGSKSSGGLWVEWSEEGTVENGTLFSYLSKDKKIFVCPIFAQVFRADPNYSHLTPHVSYCMNEYFRKGGWQGQPPMRRSAIIYASKFGLFGEENTFLAANNRYPINNLALGVGNYFKEDHIVDGCATFHNAPAGDIGLGRSNVCFADGHVEMVDPARTKDIMTPEMVKRSGK